MSSIPPAIASSVAAYGCSFGRAPSAYAARRTRRAFSAQVLDAVMRELGITNGQLARWTGVDEKLVRRWRAGDRAIAAHRLDRMRSVGLEYLRRTKNP